ncbi:Sigma-70, region 4 [Corynebacterium choanae]|uniref:Sigma-70, region 4 n=1 Tax=Corynebacterium choanae TaxID=1862358 RepID=A0A3G6JBL2_9CORY|nr:Sigma-70, region 4 [Corynebacterium choanae]
MSTEHELPKTVYARYPRHGRTARELAEKLGMHPRTAQRWTCAPREVFLARADEKRAAVKRLLLQGMTMTAIADELEGSVGTVHCYVKEARQAG